MARIAYPVVATRMEDGRLHMAFPDFATIGIIVHTLDEGLPRVKALLLKW